MLLHMPFFTAAILLCAVRDAQFKTRESPNLVPRVLTLGITLKPFRHGIHLLCLDVYIIEALKQSLVYEYAPVNSKKISRMSNILQRSRDELFVKLFEWEILNRIKYTYEQNWGRLPPLTPLTKPGTKRDIVLRFCFKVSSV